MAMKPRVAIIGSGSWATALAKLLLNNLDSITWYQRKQEDVDYFNAYGNNPRYLSSVEFDTNKINFYTSLSECFKNADYCRVTCIHSDTLKADLDSVPYCFFG